MRKFLRFTWLAALFALSLTAPASAESPTAAEGLAEEFQRLTDSVNALTAGSTPEEVEACRREFEAADFALPAAEESSGLTGSMTAPGNQSLPSLFAQMQKELAETVKDQTLSRLSPIQELQREVRELSGYLTQAGRLRQEAQASETATQMPAEMKNYLDQHRLHYDRGNAQDTAGTDWNTASEWDEVIRSLQTRQEEAGVDIQARMVSIQESLGQYNSYFQGTGPQMQNLSGLARGTMLGSGGAGLMVTCLLLGAALGAGAMLLAVKRKDRGA